MVVDLPCFSVARCLASWYAFLLLFFLRHAFTSSHWPCICLFCNLHLCPDLSFNLSKVFGSFWIASLFFRSRLWSQRSTISGVTQGFVFRRCLPRSLSAVSVTALLKLVTMESRSASSSTSLARGANLLSAQLSIRAYVHIVPTECEILKIVSPVMCIFCFL